MKRSVVGSPSASSGAGDREKGDWNPLIFS